MNYIASSIFTTCIDPQRATKWIPTINTVKDWCESGQAVCEKSEGVHLLVFYDQLPQEILDTFTGEHTTFIQVEDCGEVSPYDYRWIVYSNFIENNQDSINNIFFTDISDVIIKKNPFLEMKPNTLYSGDELGTLWDNPWSNSRSSQHRYMISDYGEVFEQYKDRLLLNCGIVGGSIEVMLDFTRKVYKYMELTIGKSPTDTDMTTHNYVTRKYFPDAISGPPLNSVFKRFEVNREDVWFVHK
jgi:hypothetical protein